MFDVVFVFNYNEEIKFVFVKIERVLECVNFSRLQKTTLRNPNNIRMSITTFICSSFSIGKYVGMKTKRFECYLKKKLFKKIQKPNTLFAILTT